MLDGLRMKLTKRLSNRYLKTWFKRCPVCGDVRLVKEPFVDGERKVTCQRCGREFLECWGYVGIKLIKER